MTLSSALRSYSAGYVLGLVVRAFFDALPSEYDALRQGS